MDKNYDAFLCLKSKFYESDTGRSNFISTHKIINIRWTFWLTAKFTRKSAWRQPLKIYVTSFSEMMKLKIITLKWLIFLIHTMLWELTRFWKFTFSNGSQHVFKSSLLRFHFRFFPKNLGADRDDHRARFHQHISTMEKGYSLHILPIFESKNYIFQVLNMIFSKKKLGLFCVKN